MKVDFQKPCLQWADDARASLLLWGWVEAAQQLAQENGLEGVLHEGRSAGIPAALTHLAQHYNITFPLFYKCCSRRLITPFKFQLLT